MCASIQMLQMLNSLWKKKKINQPNYIMQILLIVRWLNQTSADINQWLKYV